MLNAQMQNDFEHWAFCIGHSRQTFFISLLAAVDKERDEQTSRLRTQFNWKLTVTLMMMAVGCPLSSVGVNSH
jgi:hypothetical protein